MTSVDDILGPAPAAKAGSVDSVLGPDPGPHVPLPEGVRPDLYELPTPPHNSTVMDRFIDAMPGGRVLDAFGQGFKNEFGSQPYLSPETEAAMAKVKMDPSLLSAPRRAFNEVLFRPAATAIAGAWRGMNAIPGAVGRAVGAAVGADERGQDDFELMGSIAPVALGMASELGVVAKAPGTKGGFDAAPHVEPDPTGKLYSEHLNQFPWGESPFVVAKRLSNGTVMHGKPGDMHPDLGLEGEDGFSTGPGSQFLSRQEASAALNPAPTKTMASTEGLEPHTLFQDQPKVPPEIERAGNINLERITASQDVKDVIRQSAVDNGGFMEARRGEISLAQTEELADALGMTPESLNTRKIGTAFNAEEITAARNLLVQSANNVFELARNVKEGDEASLESYLQAEAKHKSIQEQVAGVTAEGGRALNAFKIHAKAVGEAKDLGAVLESLGDSPEGAAARARAIAGINSPSGVSAFINSTRKPSFKDRFLEYWINGLLSGPATHTTYSESNALLALWKGGVETPVAGAIGAARQAFSNTPVDRVFMGETGAQLHGFAQGALEGIPAGWRAIKSGVTEALPGETQMGKLVPKVPGVAGQIITVPSRVIAGIHTFGRAIGYRMELNSQAYRAAAHAGLEGDEFSTKMASLKADPPEDMMTAAVDAATQGTMMQRPNGGFGAKLESLANANVLTKMVAPFVRVGINVVDQGLVKRTPLGVMSKDVRDTLAGEHGAAARDIQISRMGVGTALGAGVLALAAQGYVTGGGPSDPKAAASWRMTGKRPYSVKVGDQWVGYHRMGSLGQIIGVAADMYEMGDHISKDDATSIATLFTNSVAKNMVDETWMRGPADLIEAIRDPDRYGASYLRNQAATLVPFSVGMGQIARATDPDLRNAQTLLDAIKVKIPGLSQTVHARYDIWGQPMEQQGSLGPDALSALAVSRVSHDPVNLEMDRLGYAPAAPEKKIRGVQLAPEQYDEYQMLSGRLAKSQLDGLVNSEGWQAIPDFAQKELYERTVRDARQTAAGLMQMRHPDLIHQGVQNRVNQIRGVAK